MILAFALPSAPVLTDGDGVQFPVRRIFCVGRNYADHAREMGHEPDRSAPFYFTKSPHHLTCAAQVPYPTQTQDYHHEVELAVLLGAAVDPRNAMAAIWGYAVSLDMTRRDLQAASKDKRRPWDTGKDVEGSAIFGPVTRNFTPADQRIALEVNGETRQEARLSALIHSIPEILVDLARLYTLGPGDVILTGTPAGVGPVQPGDRLLGRVEGLPDLAVEITKTPQ